MTIELIQNLFEEYEAVRSYLVDQGELTFASDVQGIVPKVLLLASASYFEAAITGLIVNYYKLKLGDEDVGVTFVQLKALKRQFHTLFQWNAANVNHFWSFFGPNFKQYASDIVANDQELRDDARAFLELGNLRNELVHENYMAFVLEKTSQEVFDLAFRANRFVDRLPELLAGYAEPGPAGTGAADPAD